MKKPLSRMLLSRVQSFVNAMRREDMGGIISARLNKTLTQNSDINRLHLPCFFIKPHLKWTTYGEFNSQQVAGECSLEWRRRLAFVKTELRTNKDLVVNLNNLQEESRCENSGSMPVWLYS